MEIRPLAKCQTAPLAPALLSRAPTDPLAPQHGSDGFIPFLLRSGCHSLSVQTALLQDRRKPAENSAWAVTGSGAPIPHSLETEKVVMRQAMPGLRLCQLQSKSARTTEQKGCVRLSGAAVNHLLAAVRCRTASHYHRADRQFLTALPSRWGRGRGREAAGRSPAWGLGQQPVSRTLSDSQKPWL